MTREQILDRDAAVLRAKVTLTKDQLAAIIHTCNEGPLGQPWDSPANGTIAFWLPLEQVGIEYVVMNADGHPAIAR